MEGAAKAKVLVMPSPDGCIPELVRIIQNLADDVGLTFEETTHAVVDLYLAGHPHFRPGKPARVLTFKPLD